MVFRVEEEKARFVVEGLEVYDDKSDYGLNGEKLG